MKRICLLLCLALAASCIPTRGDTMYVSFAGTGTIEKFDTFTGADLGTFASGLDSPQGVAFDHAGNLYVASGNSILRYTPSGIGSVFVDTDLNAPEGLAFDASGNLYVGNLATGTIMKFAPNGTGAVFAYFARPLGLAFDTAGNLYAAGGESASLVEKFTPGGEGSVFATANDADGLAFDAAGNLYTEEYLFNEIVKVSPDGVKSVFAHTGVSFKYGMAFDSAGDLFVANSPEHGIGEYDPSGNESVFADTGTSYPMYIAIQPVPEPSVWGLFGCGVGAIAVRRAWAKRTVR